MDRVRDRIRIKHYSKSTEQIYCHWILQYILFHGKRHPAEMGKPEIEAYLNHMAQKRHYSSSSQNQAFNAIIFLYREILEIEPPADIDALRAKRHLRIPVVLRIQITEYCISRPATVSFGADPTVGCLAATV